MFIILNLANSIFFKLDSNVSNLCFRIKNTFLNKRLVIKYMVVGNNNENVKFTIKEFESKNLIKTILPIKDSEKQKNTYYNKDNLIESNIAIKHTIDYLVCFNSLDNNEKEVSFTYNNKNNHKIVNDNEVKEHINVFYRFYQIVEEIYHNTESLYLNEKLYPSLIKKINSKIKFFFLLKCIIFILILMIQFLIFLKWINNKFKIINQIEMN